MKSLPFRSIIVSALVALTILNLSCLRAAAQGTTFTYQGRVLTNGVAFSGAGLFQFALVNTNGSTVTYWSNDGTSVNGSRPTAAVSLLVTNGLFTVTLGNTALANMQAIPASLFSTQPVLQLAVWFNDQVHGFAAITPVQTVTPAPYAAFAAFAGSASNLLGILPLSALPATILTNNESGVTLKGTFSGDGNGLTNLNLSQFTGNVSLSQLPAAVVTNGATGVTLNNGTFYGSFHGSFSGDGSGLVNVPQGGGSTTNVPGLTNYAVLLLTNSVQPAMGTPVISGGVITAVNVSFGSSGYTNTPVVTVQDYPNGNSAVVAAIVNGGVVTGFLVLAGGAGYDSNTLVVAGPPPPNDYQYFTGRNFMTNTGNQFVGAYSGDGGSLSNLNASQLSQGVLSTAVLPGFQGPNYQTIGGGKGNTASGTASTVSGGTNNTASGQNATAGGGSGNMATGDYSFVGGGLLNSATNAYATAGGGSQNTAGGSYSFVGGGDLNTANGNAAFIGGGGFNIASGAGAFVGGGGYDGFAFEGNRATGTASVVAGGVGNKAINVYATVSGGANNTASGQIATVGGGSFNIASGDYATAGGGGIE